MIVLTRRQRDILLYLFEKKECVTINELASKFDVSPRTIRYDIDLIDLFLKQYFSAGLIRRKRSEGLSIKASRQEERFILQKLYGVINYHLERDERLEAIKILLLLEKAKTYENIAEICCVSKQTIINDFPKVEKEFNSRGIKIDKIAGMGLKIEGLEQALRNYFASIINQDLNKVNFIEEIILLVLERYINEANSLICEVSNNLSRRYVDTKEVIYQLAYSLFRIDNNHVCQVDKEETNKVNDELVDYLKVFYPEIDALYISNLFNSTKLYDDSSKTLNQDKLEARNMAQFLSKELNKLLNVSENEDEEALARHLELHLEVAIYRMRNNILIENDFLDQIKISIPLIYQFTKQIIKEYENMIGLNFDEKEIAYIAMHVASAYEMNIQIETSLNIMLVCAFGLATSALLKNRFMQIISNCTIIGPFSDSEAHRYLKDNEVDLIISTSEFKSSSCPVIKVHPLLNHNDYDNIQDIVSSISYKKSCYYFIRAYRKQKNNSVIYLRDYVSKDDIKILEECSDWKKAIEIAANSLLEKGMLEKRYIEKMIEAVIEYGNYMILSPETAFVHAGGDDGINETCSSVLILKKPVVFGVKSQELVRNIVVLGLKNKEENALLKIIHIFGDEVNINTLKSKDIDVDTIYHLSC